MDISLMQLVFFRFTCPYTVIGQLSCQLNGPSCLMVLAENKMQSGPDLTLMKSLNARLASSLSGVSVKISTFHSHDLRVQFHSPGQMYVVKLQEWRHLEPLITWMDTQLTLWIRERGSRSLRWCHPQEVLSEDPRSRVWVTCLRFLRRVRRTDRPWLSSQEHAGQLETPYRIPGQSLGWLWNQEA